MSSYDLSFIAGANAFTREIFYRDVVTSTNDVAKDIAVSEERSCGDFLVLANAQTRGRGKNQVRYFSPPDVGLYMSAVLMRPAVELPFLSMAAGLAISRAIKTVAAVESSLKWPNDVLIGGKKVCGILIESTAQTSGAGLAYVIIGAGVNVNNTSFEPPIENIATSLRLASGQAINRNALVVEILNVLKSLLESDPKAVLDAYLRSLEEKSREVFSRESLR